MRKKIKTYILAGAILLMTLGSIYDFRVTTIGASTDEAVESETTEESISYEDTYDPVEVVTLDSLAKPGITVGATTYTTIKLNYSAVMDADGYEIFRSTKKNGKFKLIATTDETSYTDADLSNNKKYFYKVRSYRYNEDTELNNYSSFSATVSGRTLNLSKSIITVFSVMSDSIMIEFGNVDPDADGYQIFRSTKKKGKYKLISSIQGEDTFFDSSIPSKKRYYYKARGFKLIDGKVIFGPYSKTKSSIKASNSQGKSTSVPVVPPTRCWPVPRPRPAPRPDHDHRPAHRRRRDGLPGPRC